MAEPWKHVLKRMPMQAKKTRQIVDDLNDSCIVKEQSSNRILNAVRVHPITGVLTNKFILASAEDSSNRASMGCGRGPTLGQENQDGIVGVATSAF